jgi:hypothetical protein
MAKQKASASKHTQQQNNNNMLMCAAVGVAVAVAAYYYYVVLGQKGGIAGVPGSTNKQSVNNVPNARPRESKNTSPLSDWLRDPDMETLSKDVGCDLHVFESVDELSRRPDLLDKMTGKPFVVRNFVSSWPATNKWKLSNFLSTYGTKMVKTGSESSIVYGGGAAGITKTVNQMISDMRTHNYSDHFTFDVSILNAIPALKQDYVIPHGVFEWDNAANEKAGHVWHMLSLGPSKSGLPFHLHGATWLGLVHGAKRWFLYPPGYGPPESVNKAFNPIRPVFDWLSEVYPTLQSLKKPPSRFVDVNATDKTAHDTSSTGHRPFECVQRENDLLFLPNGWSHQTLNIGETIALGGQSALTTPDRLFVGLEALKTFPRSVDALKSAGLALAHDAIELEENTKRNLQVTSDGMVQLTAQNLQQLVYDGEDTWLIHVFEKDVGGHAEAQFARTFNAVARRLKGLVSIGGLEISSGGSGSAGGVDRIETIDTICKCNLTARWQEIKKQLATKEGVEGSTQEYRPVILLVLGGNINDQLYYPEDMPLTSTNISDFALNFFFDSSRRLGHGTTVSLGAKARRLFQESVNHLRYK